MPRQSNGTYLQPANTAAVPSTTISSTAFNTLETDIGTEITNSVDRLGRSAMQANLPMGGNKITGMADPTVSTDAVTKNYADAAISAFFSTGDVKLTYKTVADTGWLMMNDTTIGNVGSGATYANVDALALYTLFWNNISSPSANAYATVTGGLGASAAADWAGLKPMALPKMLGRALAGAGAGSGLTSRQVGQNLGVEAESLTLAQLPTGITSTNASQTISVNTPVNGSGLVRPIYGSNGTFAGAQANGGSSFLVPAVSLGGAWDPISSISGSNSISVTSSNTSGTTHSLMQPSSFLNVMVKK